MTGNNKIKSLAVTTLAAALLVTGALASPSITSQAYAAEDESGSYTENCIPMSDMISIMKEQSQLLTELRQGDEAKTVEGIPLSDIRSMYESQLALLRRITLSTRSFHSGDYFDLDNLDPSQDEWPSDDNSSDSSWFTIRNCPALRPCNIVIDWDKLNLVLHIDPATQQEEQAMQASEETAE